MAFFRPGLHVIMLLLLPLDRYRKGACYCEFNFIVYAFHSGKCNRLLHLQMAGWKIAASSQPEV